MKRLDECRRKVDMIFRPCSVDAILGKAAGMSGAEIIKEVTDSGLRGRGGAGFPTGLKWSFAAKEKGEPKYVICNADEGEPGTFKDREILERVPEKLFAGMAICARAVGAHDGFIYLRREYRYLLPKLNAALDVFNRRAKGLGLDVVISIRMGMGAYVCGEETSLIESMEGKRGEPRNKPPFPVACGYRGRPTVVNNVETLVYTAMIVEDGAAAFVALGTKDSRGAKVFSVSGDTPNPGIYELEMGMTLKEFVDLFGDGDTKAVQVGGASGMCVPRRMFADTIIGFEGVPTGGSMMLFNSGRSMYRVLRNFLEFFMEESCGQCTPCRVGCQQLLKGIEAVKRGDRPASYLRELEKMGKTMRLAAKCGLGQSVPNAFESIVANFQEEITN